MRFMTGVESLLLALSSFSKSALSDFCEIETADDEHSLVTTSGSLVTQWSIRGITHLVGQHEFLELVRSLTLYLKPYLNRPWHSLQITFNRDPDSTLDFLNEAAGPARFSAQRLGLALDDLFEARVSTQSGVCVSEQIFMTLWTHATIFPPPELTRQKKLRADLKRSHAPMRAAQRPDMVFPGIREHHRAVVHAITEDFKNAGVILETTNVHDALRDIRRLIDPSLTSRDWRPSLPGDPLPFRLPARATSDLSSLFWPPVGPQIFPSEDERQPERELVRIGQRLYSTLYVDVPPQHTSPFTDLFNRLDRDMPWRVAFMLDGDGLQGMWLKSTLAAILALSNSGNKLIVKSIKDLNERAANGEALVKLRIAATTSAPLGQNALCLARSSTLARAIESWGTCDVRVETGDPTQGFVSTLPSVSTQPIGTAAAPPLEDVVSLMPFTRPASPWDTGAIVYRTPDGKPWLYQPGSALQTAWVELYCAPPGYGKSVLMNTNNLGFVLSSDRNIPYLGGIDIGPSSRGLVELLQDALGSARRHLAVYRRLRLVAEDAINPFDCQLGCRHPLPHEAAFLANFLTLLATPMTRAAPHEGAAEVSTTVVSEVYQTLIDDAHGNPHPYGRGVDHEVDAALDAHNIATDQHTCWWEVVDALFERGDIVHASLAQRYASPTLIDAIAVLKQSDQIQSTWGPTKTATGERLIDAIHRQWITATKNYPLLAKPTAFDIGNARVVCLDLEEVAPRGGDVAKRQTAVMYMLARHVVARDHFLHPEHLPYIPEAYRYHHEERIREIREADKRLFYDEIHRMREGGESTREQVKTDIREARKRGVQIAVASQLIEDFDNEMVDNATSKFILGAGTEHAIQEAVTRFRLSETEQFVLRRRLHGPTKDGAPFLFLFDTKHGSHAQVLVLTISALEMWALSTTHDDCGLRVRLQQHLSGQETRRLLARTFPDGTARPEFARRREQIRTQGHLTTELAEGVIDAVAKELLQDRAEPALRIAN